MSAINTKDPHTSDGLDMPLVGHVRRVSGQIAVLECGGDYRPKLQELLTASGKPDVRLEAHSYGDDRLLYCLLFSPADQLVRGMEIVSTRRRITVPVGPEVLGRAIDLYGEPIDGGGPLLAKNVRPLYPEDGAITSRELVAPGEIVETGVKMIDFFAPLQRGGKMALVGGAGVGKTFLETEVLRNIIHTYSFPSIFAGIGERVREGHHLRQTLIDQKVLDRVALVFGYVNKNAAVRFRTAAAAATLAEYFRDERGEDVLFFVDNVFRFLQAGNELSSLLEEIPSEFGYQPTLQSEIAQFENRLASTKRGTITTVQTVYVPEDEFANPAVAAALPHMDSIIILSRDIARAGRYPAIDPLRSASAAADPRVIGAEHHDTLVRAMSVLNQYDRLARIVAIVGEEELSRANQEIYKRAKLILNYMTQAFFTAEPETGRGGVATKRMRVVADVRTILSGELDAISPERLLYVPDLDGAGIPARA